MLSSLLKGVTNLAAVGGSLFAALVGTLYVFQRQLLFPRPDNANPLPVRKGRLIRVDVRLESRPASVGDAVVAVYFPPTTSKYTLVFWHGNADQIGNVGDHLGAAVQRSRGWGFLGVEFPGYGLSGTGEPTEESIAWSAQRMLKHLHAPSEAGGLDGEPETTVAFGQSIGGAVALDMCARGLAGRAVLLSTFTSIPNMARALFPFVPCPERLVKDPFDNARIAQSVRAPVLAFHGTQDEIVPYSQGQQLAKLLPDAKFVSLPGAGHNDTFNGDFFRAVINAMGAFLKE